MFAEMGLCIRVGQDTVVWIAGFCYELDAAGAARNSVIGGLTMVAALCDMKRAGRKKARSNAGLFCSGVPKGIRTPVTAVKGRCPRPTRRWGQCLKPFSHGLNLVEPGGFEPPTSTLPVLRSPN